MRFGERGGGEGRAKKESTCVTDKIIRLHVSRLPKQSHFTRKQTAFNAETF